jgi:hypothetical protein
VAVTERRIHLYLDVDVDKDADPARVADHVEAFLKGPAREALQDRAIVRVDSVRLVDTEEP